MKDRPTGIIRTLPWFGAEDTKHVSSEKSRAYQRMVRGFRRLDRGRDAENNHVLIALPFKPKIEVLHCYIIIEGKVRVRANIADYLAGDQVGEVSCWDDSTRQAKWWAMLTAPVSWPVGDVPYRGFQGVRYIYEPLW